MREERQLQIILEMINAYPADQPLSRFLKDYFRSHKQMGSSDRRQASDFIYNFFRARNAFRNDGLPEVITQANFLCAARPSGLLDYCIRTYSSLDQAGIGKSLAERIFLLRESKSSFDEDRLFPFREQLSARIDYHSFTHALLEQPLVWIRTREKYRDHVLNEFRKKEFAFSNHSSGAISLPGRTALEETDGFKLGYFEIQDLASQQTSQYMNPLPGEHWWDACAASGGKSLSLVEKESRIKLTVSDIRKSILENLKTRFQRAGMTDYEMVICDLTKENAECFSDDRRFDGIIADVPCSGSGTWARSPEWLSIFKITELKRYAEMQKKIVQSSLAYLKPGGTFIYITCSVFSEENENNTSSLVKNNQLEKINEQYLQYSAERADTMYCAVFRKPV